MNADHGVVGAHMGIDPGRWPPRPAGERPTPPGAPGVWEASIRDRLFEQRVAFLWGTLDDAAANDVAAQLMTLDATGDTPIHLHVDCPGGTLGAALSLIDVVDLLGVELHATCLGQLAGPPVGVFAAAHLRRATPHSRFRLQGPVVDFHGRARDIEAFAAHHAAQLRTFTARLAQAVGRPPERVAADLDAGRFLDARQAAAYGLVDEICARPAAVYPLNPRPLGFRPGP